MRSERSELIHEQECTLAKLPAPARPSLVRRILPLLVLAYAVGVTVYAASAPRGPAVKTVPLSPGESLEVQEFQIHVAQAWNQEVSKLQKARGYSEGGIDAQRMLWVAPVASGS